jgi:hypothetical protein
LPTQRTEIRIVALAVEQSSARSLTLIGAAAIALGYLLL